MAVYTDEEFVERVQNEGGLIEFLDRESAFSAPDEIRSALIVLDGVHQDAWAIYDRILERVEEE